MAKCLAVRKEAGFWVRMNPNGSENGKQLNRKIRNILYSNLKQNCVQEFAKGLVTTLKAVW